jgi:mannitol-1-phosphate 5-dehydrogenase
MAARADYQSTYKRAVVFGAGKMACGLIGKLLHENEVHTTFVARSKNVDAINGLGGYHLRAGNACPTMVGNCDALRVSDGEEIAERIAEADVVFTAVGIDNIPAIAPLISEGLWLRFSRGSRPINIVASENLPGTGAYLKHQILGATRLSKSLLLEHNAGFSAALTRSIMTGGEVKDGHLQFSIDSVGDLTIDQQGLVDPLPVIPRAIISDEFDALFLEKLSTINLAQAAASYIGRIKNCKHVHEAANHPAIAPAVRSAVAEAVAAFSAEYPELGEMVERDARQAISRISSPELVDSVERICRGPMRKLGARERLVGPARLAVRHGLKHDQLVMTIAAALSYHDERDIQSKVLQYVLKNEGIDYILTAVCGLLPHEPLAQEIKIAWADTASAGTGSVIRLDRSYLVEKIINEALSELKLDSAAIADIFSVDDLADEFSNARVTTFLPVLVRNKIKIRMKGHTVLPMFNDALTLGLTA